MLARKLSPRPLAPLLSQSLQHARRGFHTEVANSPFAEYPPDVVSFYDDQVQTVSTSRVRIGTGRCTLIIPPLPHESQNATKSVKPVTLKELIRFGQPPLSTESLLNSARYARSELPLRLARRVRAFQKLPFIVVTNPYIKNVYKLYYDSFDIIASSPEVTDEISDGKFAEMLKDLVDRHADNIPTLARGFQECKKYINPKDMTSFLDDMIKARIGIRLIAEQCIALHHVRTPNTIGIIDTRLSPARLAKQCSHYVQELCEVNYGRAPEIRVGGQIDTVFTYVPVHLEYMLSELLKNSCRATVEHSAKNGHKHMPPIEITISRGHEEIGIRVRDEGGGVAAMDLAKIFDYSYTTVPNDVDPHGNEDSIFSGITKLAIQAGMGGPIAGLGFGLPLARMYACYFGGSMNLVSLNGYGCDVFLKLRFIDAESIQDLQI
ncbi:putative mitochondrial pyruvate dehydrogenase kinase [Jimgerdemannia flammicorona]|uniref:Protein-serine/threonine kinase n=1 Tax=Jimgerdemannia flammicorona TaxID=994334 RepID=A0A433DAN1_9FUNG|nr:putative mitochondrial pyruvate dehydrogenase kinase [Jimgerdemannia flammicorona]